MKTTLEIKNKVASIYSYTLIALVESGEIQLYDHPMKKAFHKDEQEVLSSTGIDFTGKTTRDVLLLVRDWLNEVEIA